MNVMTLKNLLRILFYILCLILPKIDSNTAKLFITNDTLNKFPLSKISPINESNCTTGKTFYWESINGTDVPYAYLLFNDSAYKVSYSKTCDICICTEENNCYRAMDNNNFLVYFLPHCLGEECHMYGVVFSYPLIELGTFVDDSNKTYIGPLPYLTNLGPQSGYLKAISISCEGCAILKNQMHCEQEFSIYNGTSAPLKPCYAISDEKWLLSYLYYIPTPLVILYVFVLYIFYTSPSFNTIVIYKLMILQGVSDIAYFICQILQELAYLHHFEGYWFMIMYALMMLFAILMNWSSLLLALNRWDIFCGLSLFPLLDRAKFFKIATIIVIAISIAHFILFLIPGFRAFVVVPFSFCSFSEIDIVVEAHYSIYFQVFVYKEEILLSICFILYAWCMINIFYKKYSKNVQSSKKEVLLFLQALIPCLLLILVNVIARFANGWSYIAVREFFQFECVHYPIVYLCLNKALRKEFKRYLIQLYNKILNKGTTSTIVFLTKFQAK